MLSLSPRQQREALLRELYSRLRAKESLYEFVKQAWPSIEGKKPFSDGWHIGAICEHLEAVLNGQIKKLLINIPPRSGKTTIISVAFPAFAWATNPTLKFVYASYKLDISLEHSRLCRTLIESPWYQARWGDIVELCKDQDAKRHFTNTAMGHRIATSVGAGSTALGGDINVMDDPNSTKESDVVRVGTNVWVDQVWPSRLNPGGLEASITVQQRTHQMDVSGHLREREPDYVQLILPMEYDPERKARTIILPSSGGKIWQDPRTKEGELLWEAGLNKATIEQRKIQLGSYNYAGQYQQIPAPAEGGIIKESYFIKWTSEKPPKFISVFQSLDTAFEVTDTSSFTGILTFGIFENEKGVNCLILLNLWRERVEYPELRKLSKDVYNDYLNDGQLSIKPDVRRKSDMMLVEAKASGISLVQDLRKAGINAYKFDPNKFGDKMLRVRLATPFIEAGLVYLPTRGPDFKKFNTISQTLVEHCKNFPNTESRDVVDCLTQAILHLSRNGILRLPLDKDAYEGLTSRRKTPYGYTQDPL